MGIGGVWDSNSNLGSHPFLESMFFTSLASKFLEMHAHLIIHPYIFLSHAVGSPGHFSLMFPTFPHIAMAEKTHFYVIEWMWNRDSHFGGFKGSFFPPPLSWSLMCISLMFLFIFPNFSKPGNPLLYCSMNGQRRTTIWGFIKAIFSLVIPIGIFWFHIHNLGMNRGHFCSSNVHGGFLKSYYSPMVFSPSAISISGCQTFLYKPKSCILLWSASLC